MKKIFSILFVSMMAFMAVSCYTEDLAVFDLSKAKAPVLGSYEVGDKAITASYTPGSFNQNFNKNVQPNHFFVITNVDGKSVSKTVTTSNKDGVLSASINSLNNTLISMGYKEGDVVSLVIHIRASMQTNAGDNGRNGFVDSDGTIEIPNFEIVFPKGSPYMEYTETSPYSVIGSLSNYEISWDGDLEMWMTPDGTQHVAKCVTINAGDEFKFRKDQDWGVNFGGDFGSLGSPFEVTQDGPNIVAPAGVYDLWLDLDAGTATLTEAFQAYPDHKEASNWSVIGSLAEYGISWDGDILMLTDGTTHVAQGVKLAASDEFKFRQDKAWTVNLGGDFGGLGSDFEVTQDGPNVKVGGDGIFDLIVNPGAGTAQVVETLGGGVSGKIGGDEPEPGPEPVPVTGWNIIGLNGDWENDILATNNGSLWTAYITAEGDTEFKWRKDAGWDENYGLADGATVVIGEPIPAAADGPNIPIGAGFWKVVLDTEAMTITITAGDVWSLIGDFNGWAADVDMTLVDGKWVSPVTKINANGFKIRYNHDWTVSVGGTFEAFKTPFPVGDENIMLPAEGEYIVTYDPESQTIMVEKSISGWNVIGLNGDWSDDVIATEKDGVWSVRVNAPEATNFKWRKDGGWDENVGGTLVEIGVPFEGGQDGPNIDLPAGYWLLSLDMTGATPMLTVADGEVWSLIGDFNGWGGDVDMVCGDDGVWVSPPTYLNANGFKIRHNHDWTLSVGGTFAALGEPFEAISENGPNIMLPADGEYIVMYDAVNQTITVKSGVKSWSVIGVNGDWGTDYVMTEVAPGIWMSELLEITEPGWKIRFDKDWGVNRGGKLPEDAPFGTYVAALQDGPNMPLTGAFKVVYNANNETLGALGWGVIGTITGWATDIPMNLASDGKWYSVPVTLAETDEIKIRWNGDWSINCGGTCEAVETPFSVAQDGPNIKAPAAGTYMLVYDPTAEQVTLTKNFWGLIGDFNGWAADVFMMYDGTSWVAYRQTLAGGWKIRQGADWGVNRGGTFIEAGTAFEVVQDGSNINVGELADFDVYYVPTEEKMVIVK